MRNVYIALQEWPFARPEIHESIWRYNSASGIAINTANARDL